MCVVSWKQQTTAPWEDRAKQWALVFCISMFVIHPEAIHHCPSVQLSCVAFTVNLMWFVYFFFIMSLQFNIFVFVCLVCVCVCVFSVFSGHLVSGVHHGRDGKGQRHLPGHRSYPSLLSSSRSCPLFLKSSPFIKSPSKCFFFVIVLQTHHLTFTVCWIYCTPHFKQRSVVFSLQWLLIVSSWFRHL